MAATALRTLHPFDGCYSTTYATPFQWPLQHYVPAAWLPRATPLLRPAPTARAAGWSDPRQRSRGTPRGCPTARPPPPGSVHRTLRPAPTCRSSAEIMRQLLINQTLIYKYTPFPTKYELVYWLIWCFMELLFQTKKPSVILYLLKDVLILKCWIHLLPCGTVGETLKTILNICLHNYQKYFKYRRTNRF